MFVFFQLTHYIHISGGSSPTNKTWLQHIQNLNFSLFLTQIYHMNNIDHKPQWMYGDRALMYFENISFHWVINNIIFIFFVELSLSTTSKANSKNDTLTIIVQHRRLASIIWSKISARPQRFRGQCLLLCQNCCELLLKHASKTNSASRGFRVLALTRSVLLVVLMKHTWKFSLTHT